jgi:hypothetical protein
MAITFPIAGVSATFSASQSPSFTLGTAPQADDVLVAMISSTTSAALLGAFTWTNVLGGNTDVESDSHQGNMVYHVVTSAEASASTVTWTLTNHYSTTETGRISVAVLRGVNTTTPLNSAASTFSSTNTATPWGNGTFTITSMPDGVVMMGVAGDGTQTQTFQSGWDGTGGVNRASGSATQSNYLWSSNQTSFIGQTGTASVTPSAGDEFVCIYAAFNAASGGGGGTPGYWGIVA